MVAANHKPMDKHTYTYGCLSSQRGRLMGAAMLMVVLFHVGGARHDTIFYCLSRCGNVGVDVFLFLSGIGLWFSWSRNQLRIKNEELRIKNEELRKNAGEAVDEDAAPRSVRSHSSLSCSSLMSFFRRRYVRVYPAWLVVACLYYLPRYFDGHLSAADTALSIALNWGFWEHDELTFWFVPSIMALYTVAPAYMELIRRHPECRLMPVVAMVGCVLAQYWPPLHSAVGHIEIFTSRIPIFLIGINMGQAVMERRPIKRAGWWMLLAVFALSALACVNFEDGLRGRFPLFLERMVYIPLAVSMSLLLARLMEPMPRWAGAPLAFVGAVSLEIYLIHAQFVLLPLHRLHLGYWPTAIAVVVVSALLGWLLHKAVGLLTRKIA